LASVHIVQTDPGASAAGPISVGDGTHRRLDRAGADDPEFAVSAELRAHRPHEDRQDEHHGEYCYGPDEKLVGGGASLWCAMIDQVARMRLTVELVAFVQLPAPRWGLLVLSKRGPIGTRLVAAS
jgi:hypothetical protein